MDFLENKEAGGLGTEPGYSKNYLRTGEEQDTAPRRGAGENDLQVWASQQAWTAGTALLAAGAGQPWVPRQESRRSKMCSVFANTFWCTSYTQCNTSMVRAARQEILMWRWTDPFLIQGSQLIPTGFSLDHIAILRIGWGRLDEIWHVHQRLQILHVLDVLIKVILFTFEILTSWMIITQWK